MSNDTTTAPWQVRSFFINSTFGDIQGARDRLRLHALPRLDEGLRKRCPLFESVDLRPAGLGTVPPPVEQRREFKVRRDPEQRPPSRLRRWVTGTELCRGQNGCRRRSASRTEKAIQSASHEPFPACDSRISRRAI